MTLGEHFPTTAEERKEIDTAVLEQVRSRTMTQDSTHCADLMVLVLLPKKIRESHASHKDRLIDHSLQRLRRAGKIYFQGGSWWVKRPGGQ